MGDERFCDFVQPLARRAGRTVVGHLRPDDTSDGLRDGWQELIIEAELFDRFRDRHGDVLRRAGRVWLLPSTPDPAARPTPLLGHPLPPLGRVAKRAIDVVLATVLLLLVLPALLVAMAAVRLDSAGPAIFKQVRVGTNGRRFRLYKLRTMVSGNDDSVHRTYVAGLISGHAEQCEGLFKLVGDSRITTVGRLLRRFSIDELPQLWNVVKGDMSLVGPRPPLPSEVELYGGEAWQRLRVKPGITGMWQVSGRSRLSFAEMVALDVEYWQRWSLLLDLQILLRTPAVVFSANGA